VPEITHSNQSPDSFVWQAPEFLEKQRRTDWYWALGIISVSIAVTAILFNNILFAIFIVIAFLTVLIHGSIKPRFIEIVISQDGVLVGSNFWPYSSLSSFWFEDFFDQRRIIFGTKSIVNPTFYILLPEINKTEEKELKSFLSQYIEEKKTEESLSEKIMEYLGF
jgi:hypothetical protein